MSVLYKSKMIEVKSSIYKWTSASLCIHDSATALYNKLNSAT